MRVLLLWLVLVPCFGIADDESLLAFTSPQMSMEANSRTPRVAIIIDDVGYNRQQGQQLLDLPGALTFALIPHTPNAEWFAERAHHLDKEIMLHMPMSHIHHEGSEQAVLHSHMPEDEFNHLLDHALDSIPYARGVNNHMGSQLTQEEEPMSRVMRTLNQRRLYFIDSRTTEKSVAWQVARQHQVPSLERDVFLDHEQDEEFIAGQFSRLIALAKRRGYAIAIAHPYPETMDFLADNLSQLSTEGVQLVPASELIKNHSTPLEFP